MRQALLDVFFIAALCRRIKSSRLQLFGQVVLGNDRIVVIVSVLVILAVPEIFHQSGGGISDVHGDR